MLPNNALRPMFNPTYHQQQAQADNRKSPHSLTHGAEPFLRSYRLCSYSRTSQRFMEPLGSLPRSQEASTGPYSEPDRSNPYHPIISL
jgi:hypothetical protein